MVIETDAGPVHGWRLTESEYLVQLTMPTGLDLCRKAGIAYVEVGCPHAVAELPGLSWDDRDALRERAKALRFDAAFPKGANVNFYTWLGPGHIRILTYERGVEDYTLACGTGTAATACALWAAGKLPGGKLTAENPGGTLTVTVEGENGIVTRLLLQGPTEITNIFER
jgi:diaminopimelate epimerase